MSYNLTRARENREGAWVGGLPYTSETITVHLIKSTDNFSGKSSVSSGGSSCCCPVQGTYEVLVECVNQSE